MQIDFLTVLTNFAGQPLPDGDEHLTLLTVAISALMVLPKPEVPGTERFDRYELARKLNLEKCMGLLPEEITKIKDLIGAIYGPVVVGPAFNLLNGTETKKEED